MVEPDYSLNTGINKYLQSFYQGRRDRLMGKVSEGKIFLRAENGYYFFTDTKETVSLASIVFSRQSVSGLF